ncbi:protein chibby homolog 1-like [Trichomycterus rosablanca]|uniref:protein chibby homolog 1-like n=1 Tax=Trichomycterus rosablanca TaxID=2290929 RepID=UPI002F359086
MDQCENALNMPLCNMTDIWNPKKPPVRQVATLSSLYNLDLNSRSLELGLQAGPPTLKLGNHSMLFKNGRWRCAECAEKIRLRSRIDGLRRRLKDLEEENNMLKLRLEVLKDMMVDVMVDKIILERELSSHWCRQTMPGRSSR